MSRDYLKRWIGTHAALAFLLLPGLCAFPLLALITPPSPARALFLGVWALLALALAALVARVAIRLRRAASDELRRRAVADNDERFRRR
jgi:chromate transport protein ChrA